MQRANAECVPNSPLVPESPLVSKVEVPVLEPALGLAHTMRERALDRREVTCRYHSK
jgi:hypothetical protein